MSEVRLYHKGFRDGHAFVAHGVAECWRTVVLMDAAIVVC